MVVVASVVVVVASVVVVVASVVVVVAWVVVVVACVVVVVEGCEVVVPAVVVVVGWVVVVVGGPTGNGSVVVTERGRVVVVVEVRGLVAGVPGIPESPVVTLVSVNVDSVGVVVVTTSPRLEAGSPDVMVVGRTASG